MRGGPPRHGLGRHGRTLTGAGLIAVPLGDTVVAQQEDRTEEEGSRLDIPPDAFALDVVGSGPGDWEQLQARLMGIIGQCYPLGDPDKGMVAELIGFTRSWRPDLVLWDPLCLPAAVAARVTGAAHARILWGLDKMGWGWEKVSGRSGVVSGCTPEAT